MKGTDNHPKCKELKITHLTFANDLLLFSKGNLQSVSALLEAFEMFCQSSGLTANRQKSEIYFAGVSEGKRREIIDFAQLNEGKLPFRYLGIPLNAKRLSVAQYQPLIEKMVSCIRH